MESRAYAVVMSTPDLGPILEDLFGVRAEDIADARVDQAWPELTETDNGSGSA